MEKRSQIVTFNVSTDVKGRTIAVPVYIRYQVPAYSVDEETRIRQILMAATMTLIDVQVYEIVNLIFTSLRRNLPDRDLLITAGTYVVEYTCPPTVSLPRNDDYLVHNHFVECTECMKRDTSQCTNPTGRSIGITTGCVDGRKDDKQRS